MRSETRVAGAVGSRVAVVSPGHCGGSGDRGGRIVDVVERTAGDTVYAVAWDDGRTTFVRPEAAILIAAGDRH